MNAEQVRFLYEYDRWATRRVLGVLEGLQQDLWERPNAVGDMSLGAVLVHQLGAAQRWRTAFSSQGEERGPSPEEEPLLSIEELRRRWEAEWATVNGWLARLDDGFASIVFEGIPVWQMIIHVTNHGTQHRAEAAALLTAQGRSPGELDMINYAEEMAGQA